MDQLFHDITAPNITYVGNEPYARHEAQEPFPFPKNNLEVASNDAFRMTIEEGGYILIRTTDADFEQIRCEIIIPGKNPGPPTCDPYISIYAGGGNVLSVAIFAAYRQYLDNRYTIPKKEKQNGRT